MLISYLFILQLYNFYLCPHSPTALFSIFEWTVSLLISYTKAVYMTWIGTRPIGAFLIGILITHYLYETIKLLIYVIFYMGYCGCHIR